MDGRCILLGHQLGCHDEHRMRVSRLGQGDFEAGYGIDKASEQE